jgi:hypothetical protein
MKILMMVITVAMISSTASAELNFFKKRKEKREKATQTLRQKVKIDLEAEPSVGPTDDMDVSELLLERKDLTGQVIELEFDRTTDLKQMNQGYTVHVSCRQIGRSNGGITLLVPKDGLEFFEKLSKSQNMSREEVYVEILPGGGAAKALGTRYRKDKPEGERYTW